MRADVVEDRARLDDAGPPDDAGDAVPALPVRVLLAAERRRAAVGPAHALGAVVGRVHDDGVVRDPEVVELLEKPGRHARRARPCRPGRGPGRSCPRDVFFRWVQMCIRVEFHHRNHGFLDLWARSMKSRAPAVISSSIVSIRFLVSGPVSWIRPPALHLQHPSWAELLLELGVFRVVGVLGLLLGIQVVEVAEELVEAVRRRQELVAIAQVVLAVLAGHVTERLEQLGQRGVLGAAARGPPPAGRPWSGRCGSATGR